MLDARAAGAAVVVLGFEAADPGGYGRLVVDADGALAAIVEARDADRRRARDPPLQLRPARRRRATLLALLAEVAPRQRQGRILPDRRRRRSPAPAASPPRAITCPEAETLGVNSRADLAAAEAAFQARARAEAMENGATLTDPATVWFALDTVIGRDVMIGPNVVFGPERHRRVRRDHPRLLPPRGLPRQPRRRASARSPGCAPAPRSPRTRTSATSSRSRTRSSRRAPRPTT